MPTATQITLTQLDLTGARCPALFCSGVQGRRLRWPGWHRSSATTPT